MTSLFIRVIESVRILKMWSRQAMNDDQVAAETNRNVFGNNAPQLHHLNVHSDEVSMYPILPGNATYPTPQPPSLISMFPYYFYENYPRYSLFDRVITGGAVTSDAYDEEGEKSNSSNEKEGWDAWYDYYGVELPSDVAMFKDIDFVSLFGSNFESGNDDDSDEMMEMPEMDETPEEATEEEPYEEEDTVLYMSPSGDRDMSQALPDPQEIEDVIRDYCDENGIKLPDREIVITAPVMDESRYSMVPGIAIDFSVLPQDDDDLMSIIERIAQANDMWLY